MVGWRGGGGVVVGKILKLQNGIAAWPTPAVGDAMGFICCSSFIVHVGCGLVLENYWMRHGQVLDEMSRSLII